MDIVDVLILGLVQGLTEFIPVSSSGHLVLAQYLLSGTPNHLFIEFINAGTFTALVVFFHKRIKNLFVSIFKKKDYRLMINIILTSIPAIFIGFILSDFISSSWFFASAIVVAIAMFIVGLIMVVSDKIPHMSAVEDGSDLSKSRAFVIGFAQATALIPGVSRSGATILAGKFSGLSNKSAAEYSFMVSLPIMLGVLLNVIISDTQYLIDNLALLVISNIVAFVVGILAVKFLIDYLSKHGLVLFGWYRIVLSGILLIVIFAT